MLILILELIIGLFLIVYGSNFLVEGSTSVAKKLGISQFVVGMTIVGIGTSTPEMVVSFISAIEGKCDMAVGNIVGSNLANTFLILGLVAMIKPLGYTKNNLYQDIPFCILASLLLFFFCLGNQFFLGEPNNIGRIEGALFLLSFAIFMYFSFKPFKFLRFKKDNFAESKIEEKIPSKIKTTKWAIITILGGLAGLIIGGNIFVSSASTLATKAGVSDAFIGITIMALGTSLPELAASLTAALKGRGQLALGNIVGSNISNILLILGGSALIHPLTLNNIGIIDISLVLLSSILLLLVSFIGKKKYMDRWNGLFFLIIYITYISWLIFSL
ncbi:MAG: calcium/sodium antiporter [Bacteroidales bacterium]